LHFYNIFTHLFFSFELLTVTSLAFLQGYAPLMSDFDDFWQRRLFTQISDCWNRPINSCPGSWIRVMEREFYWDTKWQRKRLQYVSDTLSDFGSLFCSIMK
jgi:hypothetical protein